MKSLFERMTEAQRDWAQQTGEHEDSMPLGSDFTKAWDNNVPAIYEADAAQNTRITELEAEVARMRTALKPFADCADALDYEDEARSERSDEPFVTPDDEWAKFRLLAGDYRRARAAYSSTPQDQEKAG